MNRSSLSLTVITALTLLTGPVAASDNPEVVVVGDALPDLPAAACPTPGKPIHYVLLGNVEKDLGYPKAGMPRPDPKAIEAGLAKVLAGRGFIRTKAGGPMPQIALTLSWGTACLATEDTPGFDQLTGKSRDPGPIPDDNQGGGTPLSATAETWTPPVLAYNLKEIRQLLGLTKPHWQRVPLTDVDRLSDALGTDRVYLQVIAFDFPALLRKQKTVLWRTSMSIDALDHALPDSFATMLASASPYFGRNTDAPVLVDDRVRQTSVTLGNLEVIGEVPAPTRK